ncbi:unnamed protein product [Schistocephalus solidus]|uniref:Uncharacterized protein n=1 Tax=Schistocephalus solidus TaxID=70667 RepID=A0A3P7DEQ7_SCHSO|nr:unnamed protein product [Schistocephalus solidus]
MHETSASELTIISNDRVFRKIAPTAFVGYKNLKSLTIRTHLKPIDGIKWETLQSLSHLSLSGCSLRALPTFGFLRSLSSLKYLNLSSNLLSFLPPDLTATVPNLRWLDISSNSFEEFPLLTSTGKLKSVNVENNPFVCNEINAWLYQKLPFEGIDFPKLCTVLARPYSIDFVHTSFNQSVRPPVAGDFLMNCSVNSPSFHWRFAVHSPIGFIPGPGWTSHSPQRSPLMITFSYKVQPVQASTIIEFKQITPTSATVSVQYVRGHHLGDWRCVARSTGNVYPSPSVLHVSPISQVHDIYMTSLVFGFIIMAIVLLLAIFMGSVRYLKETKCFTKPQMHKYTSRTLIGVIPVPGPEKKFSVSFEGIQLNQRICPPCLLQTCFFCAHCQTVHFFTEMEVEASPTPNVLLTDIEEQSLQNSTPHKPIQRKLNASKEHPAEPEPYLDPLLTQKTPRQTDEAAGPSRPSDDVESSGAPVGIDRFAVEIQNSLRASCQGDNSNYPSEAQVKCSYNFPTEYCHCYHQAHYFTTIEEETVEKSMRDVKLIVPDEKLAQEYTDALQELKDAAMANDTLTFRERLEDFREKLRHDVGTGVRVARSELVTLRTRSAKSVAFLRNQSTVAAQRVKAGLSQVKDGMRSVAELCGVGGTIGQSISIISISKDEDTQTSKERCFSEFHF